MSGTLEEEAVDENGPTHENIYECDGVKINFPYSAYKCQEEMMQEIIKGVVNSQNCLLESPRGTGKTAALLCSLLAWQQKYSLQEKLKTNNNNNSNVNSSSTLTVQNAKSKPPKIYYATKTPTKIKAVVTELKKTDYAHVPMTILGSREQFCVNPEVRQKSEESASKSKLKDDIINKLCEDLCGAAAKGNPAFSSQSTSSTSKCPYFESTQKSKSDFTQLLQERGALDIEDLVNYGKEHRKCPYYGSKTLIDGANIIFCTFNHLLQKSLRVRMGASNKIQFENSILVFDEAHNVEGLCSKLGSLEFTLEKVEEVKRILLEAAGKCEIPPIKLEPLNILINSFIHLSRWLKAESQEEEESKFVRIPLGSRFSDDDPDQDQNKDEEEEDDKMCLRRFKRDLNVTHFAKFKSKLKRNSNSTQTSNFTPGPSNNNNNNNNKKAKLETKEEELLLSFPDLMRKAHFGPEHLPSLWSAYVYMEDEQSSSSPLATKDDILLKLDKKAVNFISSLLSTLQYLFQPNKNETEANENPDADSNSDLYLFPRLRDYKIDLYKSVYINERVSMKLVLMCVNPGVVFEKIKECRTVILTSSSLSPMNSFPSELDIPFERRLTCNHQDVLSPDCYFVSVIDRFKKKSPELKMTHRNITGQDCNLLAADLGRIILSICKTVPNGILVFVPSKPFFRKFKSSFRQSGLLDKLAEVKPGGVFWEMDVEEENKGISELISEYVKGAEDGGKGALLFAFCRGRVSEEMDFSDEQARAIITIGIPLLSPYTHKIMAKKQYNSARYWARQDPFTGDRWSEASTYRALNQAFGQCIRHPKDWGLICMIDSRISQDRTLLQSLPNWVGEGITGDRTGTWKAILPRIQTFVQQHTTNETNENSSLDSQ